MREKEKRGAGMSNPASYIMAGNLGWLLEQERQAVVQALEEAGIEVPDFSPNHSSQV